MKTTQTWKIGDCLQLLPEIPDKSIDLILTDPPYGLNIASTGFVGGADSNTKNGKLTAFGIQEWDKAIPTKEVFKEMFRISKNQIIFGGNYFIEYLTNSPCWIIWDKDNLDSPFADCELAWTSFTSATRIFKWRWNGMLQEDMKNKEHRVHPTQKPVGLFKKILMKYSKEGDAICDPFLGSGTTLEACQDTNRNCIGFEISPDWEKHYRKRLRLDNAKLDAWTT